MRVAVLADIGQPVYHVGDEAIGMATAEALAFRGVQVVLLTRDEEHTRARFPGASVMTTLQFPWPPVERDERLAEIRKAIASKDVRAGIARLGLGEFIAELDRCDAVHIAGGGNLNSTYGWLLSERVAVGLIAAALGKPVTLSGQTLGPPLDEVDSAALADLLRVTRVAGLRDAQSVMLARELAGQDHTSKIVKVLDDATFLDSWARRPGEGGKVESGTTGDTRGIVVTFSEDLLDALGENSESDVAGFLDRCAERTGLSVTFVPHMATPGLSDGDEEVHWRIAERMQSTRPVLLAIEDADRSQARLRTAALVITSRFHPAVFSLAHGNPVLAFGATGYAMARLRGVLQNWGLDGHAVPAPALLEDGMAEVAAELAESESIRRHLAELGPRRAEAAARWFDVLVASFSGAVRQPLDLPDAPVFSPPAALAEAGRRHSAYGALAARTEQLVVEAERYRTRGMRAEQQLDALRGHPAVRTVARLPQLAHLARAALAPRRSAK